MDEKHYLMKNSSDYLIGQHRLFPLAAENFQNNVLHAEKE